MSSRDPSYFVGKPVESLQHMLRVVSQSDRRLQPVVPDGIYGQSTMAAVMAFQRAYGLPATGVVNQRTWDRLVWAYEKARVFQDHAEPIRVILNPGQILAPGQSNHHVSLVQAMLRTLGSVYGGFPQIQVSGTMDAPTVVAVKLFQRLSGLPVTGSIDRITWQYLARHYPLAAGSGGQSQER